MHLEVSGPLVCGTVAWRARAAGEMLTVVCKATYDLHSGECVLRAVQEPLRERDQPYGDDPRRPMYAPADLVPHKPRADVVLVGSAFAPGAVPVPSLIVRLAVAGIDKSIGVHAERRRYPNGQVVSGAPFARASLGWEHAAAAPTNPIGVRSDVAVDTDGAVVLPRLVMPQAAPGSPTLPAGFGPVPPHWPGRLEKLGRSGIHALPRSWNTATLPDDLNPQFFQVAPPDQQTRLLRADEPLLLVNMSPTLAHLATRLPGVCPAAWIERPGRGPEALAVIADTLWIDTDRALCTLTWRCRVQLSHAAETVVLHVRMEGSASRPADPIAAAIRQPGPAGALSESAFAERLSAVMEQARKDGATLPVSDAAVSAPALPFEGTDEPRPTQPPIVQAPQAVVPAPEPPPMIGPVAAFGAALQTPAPVPAMGSATETKPVAPLSNAPAPAAGEAEPLARSASKPTLQPAGGLETDEVLQLLWYAPESMARIRRRKAWRAILDEIDEQPIDAELDDAELSAMPADVENRRTLAAILTRGEPLGIDTLESALVEAVHDGTFTPKIALAAGELRLPFCELGLLQALVAAVTPIAADDDKLRAAVRAASDFAALPSAVSAPAVAEGLAARIKELLRQGRRVPVGAIEAQAERAALEQRAYQKMTVLGGPHLRALLQQSDRSGGVPAYLPERLSAELPMFQRFKVRLLAEVHPPVDQQEAAPVSLKVVALGRVLRLSPRR